MSNENLEGDKADCITWGLDGFVSFTAKSRLIKHYEKTLGAYHFGGQRMIIPTLSAEKLVEKYFKN